MSDYPMTVCNESQHGVQVADWQMNTGAFDTRVIPPASAATEGDA